MSSKPSLPLNSLLGTLLCNFTPHIHLTILISGVPREVIRWAMRKLGVEEWLVLAVISMCTGTKTVLRTVYGNSNCFEVKVGMHQRSALSPLLFVIVMEVLSREFRVALPWELLYADDLVVIAETEDDLLKKLNEWKDFVENRGMRVNMNKTKVMISGERQKVTQKTFIADIQNCLPNTFSLTFSCYILDLLAT